MLRRIWAWIVGVFGVQRPVEDNEHNRHIDVKKMLPSRFEPLRQNRWLLEVHHIDAFLVKAVKLPKIKPALRKGLSPVVSQMTIEVYNCADVDLNVEVLDWFTSGEKRRAELKFLGSTGEVHEIWSMMLAPVEFKSSELDYNENKLHMTTLTVQPSLIRIRGRDGK